MRVIVFVYCFELLSSRSVIAYRSSVYGVYVLALGVDVVWFVFWRFGVRTVLGIYGRSSFISVDNLYPRPGDVEVTRMSEGGGRAVIIFGAWTVVVLFRLVASDRNIF